MTRNLGIILLADQFVRQHPEIVAGIFARIKFVPIGIQEIELESGDVLQYKGISPVFEKVDEGLRIPRYLITPTLDNGGNVEQVEVTRQHELGSTGLSMPAVEAPT